MGPVSMNKKTRTPFWPSQDEMTITRLLCVSGLLFVIGITIAGREKLLDGFAIAIILNACLLFPATHKKDYDKRE